MMPSFLKKGGQFLKTHKKPIFMTMGVFVILLVVCASTSLAFTKAYEGRVYPNVFVGTINVGELTQADASQVIQQHVDALLNEGLTMSAGGQTATLDLRFSSVESPDVTHDVLFYDVAGAAEVAMGVGRGDSWLRNVITPLWLLVEPEHLQVLPEMDEENIRSQIQEAFGELETPAVSADYVITKNDDEFQIDFLAGTDGEELNIDSALSTLFDDANDLDLHPLTIKLRTMTYDMTQADALTLSNQIQSALLAAPFTLTYTSENMREYSWIITQKDLIDWLYPLYYYQDPEDDGLWYPSMTSSDNTIPGLGFQGDAYDAFIEEIANDVNVDPVNAKFSMENGVVTEFAGSQDGIEFDESATMSALREILAAIDMDDPQTTLEITVKNTSPEVATSDVNNFGITEIIGVGISNYGNSPSNRIANIQHGASKLNGLLIAPGQQISLIDELGPFTVADGYLPELVIKGDEIKPEVGGGLCQIGTTTFRAVMNSGLQIDERQNHSLVVSYYNDPANGNPGTDATIYDPYPDFKFTNNYDTYILLTTEVDTSTHELAFTFWGTSDGREGSYSAPVILSWSGYGEPVYTETLNLEPGEQQCQLPHPGATAQFTYTVDYADGTQFSQTYTSVYRSLPQICLVGVETLRETECPEGEVCEETENTSGETTDSTDTEAADVTPTDAEGSAQDAESEGIVSDEIPE